MYKRQGLDLDGNTILLRWSGVVPTLLEVEADIEDITDPGGYFPVAFSNITTYAESSVGLSLLKADSRQHQSQRQFHGHQRRRTAEYHPVSYTHLDVYKRQVHYPEEEVLKSQ